MLRVLIVDDEDLARSRLKGLVADSVQPQAQVVGEAANASQALAWLSMHSADVLLLDVQMPGLVGTELAARLRHHPNPPAVVFVTAHAEHALRAFELDAVDYLTKPVRRERLHAALGRAALRRARPPAAAAPPADQPMLVVSDRGRMVRVPVHEVLYLKAELKYVTMRTAVHTYVLDDALTDLEQRLGPGFLRIHRNALVARRAVRALERRQIEGQGDDEATEGWAVRVSPTDEWLAVSRRQVASVREALAEEGL